MWRCFPQKSGFSLAELFFGRWQRSLLPTLQLHHQPIPLPEASSKHAHFCQLMRAAHDKRANKLPSLAIDQCVLVQHHDSKQWSIKGVIYSIRPDGISFVIQLPSGQHIVRGRRLIRPDWSTPKHTSTEQTSSPQPIPPQQSNNNPAQPTTVNKRPKRAIRKPGRFLD